MSSTRVSQAQELRPPGGARGPLAVVSAGVVSRPRARRRRRVARFRRATADRYELYQLAVQSPEDDVRFLSRRFRQSAGREARTLREDFCGTALLCARWVASSPQRRAIGYDLDPEPLAWGRARHIAKLGPAAERVRLERADVRSAGPRVDVRVALNFSYCVFRERAELLGYLRACRASLAPGGLFALDVHGGPESIEDVTDVRRIEGGFTYLWEQESYNPFTAECRRHISFRFRDGSRWKRAFTYHWRLWSMPELLDLLSEAGFTRVETYGEGWDEKGESGNGEFRKKSVHENCSAWIAYVVAWR